MDSIDYKKWLVRLLTLETRLALSSILARTTFISQREIFVNGYSANFKLDGKQRLITSVDNMISTFMVLPDDTLQRLRILKTLGHYWKNLCAFTFLFASSLQFPTLLTRIFSYVDQMAFLWNIWKNRPPYWFSYRQLLVHRHLPRILLITMRC